MKVYYHDQQDGDCRLPHDSGEELSTDHLAKLGVLYHQFPIDLESSPESVDKLAQERNYVNKDDIVVSPQAMGDVYEEKIKMFFNEHMHEDEEIRYIKSGAGYFDVRNEGDRWVRIRVDPGDLLVIPSGIYHRFTVDTDNYIQATRLFKAAPKWTPLNRGEDTDVNNYRQQYLKDRTTGFVA